MLEVLYSMKTIKGSQYIVNKKSDIQKQVTKPYNLVMFPLKGLRDIKICSPLGFVEIIIVPLQLLVTTKRCENVAVISNNITWLPIILSNSSTSILSSEDGA